MILSTEQQNKNLEYIKSSNPMTEHKASIRGYVNNTKYYRSYVEIMVIYYGRVYYLKRYYETGEPLITVYDCYETCMERYKEVINSFNDFQEIV